MPLCCAATSDTEFPVPLAFFCSPLSGGVTCGWCSPGASCSCCCCCCCCCCFAAAATMARACAGTGCAGRGPLVAAGSGVLLTGTAGAGAATAAALLAALGGGRFKKPRPVCTAVAMGSTCRFRVCVGSCQEKRNPCAPARISAPSVPALSAAQMILSSRREPGGEKSCKADALPFAADEAPAPAPAPAPALVPASQPALASLPVSCTVSAVGRRERRALYEHRPPSRLVPQWTHSSHLQRMPTASTREIGWGRCSMTTPRTCDPVKTAPLLSKPMCACMQPCGSPSPSRAAFAALADCDGCRGPLFACFGIA